MSEELVMKEQSFDLISNELERRTKAYALNRHPDLFQFPKGVMYLITHDNYSGGLDWQANDFGYLSLLRDDVDVEFKNWVMYANGELATKMSFKDRYTDEHLSDIDKPLISALFSVVLMKLRTDLDKVCPPGYSNDVSFKAKLPQEIRNVDDDTLFNWYHKDLFGYSVPVYVPDLMKYLGYTHPNNDHMNAFLARIHRLSRVMGIMEFEDNHRRAHHEFPLMNYGYEEETNVLYIHSPYMNKLVERVLRDEIPLKNKKGQLMDEKGRPIFKPPVTSLVHPAIVSAKNKRAVEVVFQIAVFIEHVGVKTPHISVDTLIGRCYELSSTIMELDQDRKSANQILRRTFTAVWRYIEQYTDIPEQFEYEEFIPSVRDYNKVLYFKHKNGIAQNMISPK